MQNERPCLASADVYAFHDVKWGCTTHISIRYIVEGTVRNILLGIVVSWERHLCQGLANKHSC